MLSDLYSLLLAALEQAQHLIAEQPQMAPPTSPQLQEELESDRGGLRSVPLPPPHQPVQTLTPPEAHLATLRAQLGAVQAWLHANPEVLRILDACIRNEVKQMEQRTNRTALLLNTLFTIFGAVLGLGLPPLVSWLSRLLGN